MKTIHTYLHRKKADFLVCFCYFYTELLIVITSGLRNVMNNFIFSGVCILYMYAKTKKVLDLKK